MKNTNHVNHDRQDKCHNPSWSRAVNSYVHGDHTKDSLLDIAKISLSINDISTAIQAQDMLLKEFSEDREVLLEYGKSLIARNMIGKAIALWKDAVAKAVLAPNDYVTIAETYLEKGLYNETIWLMDRVLEKYPTGPAYYAKKIRAAIGQKNYLLAGDTCVKAWRIFPDFFDYFAIDQAEYPNFLEWAETSVIQSGYPVAVRRWEVMRKLFPSIIRTSHSKCALVCIANNKYARAMEYVQKGLAAGDRDISLWLCEVKVLLHQGEYEKALMVCDRIYKLDPANPAVAEEYAKILDDFGRIEEAANILNKYFISYRPYIKLLKLKYKIDLKRYKGSVMEPLLNLLYYLHNYSGFYNFKEGYFTLYINTLLELSKLDKVFVSIHQECVRTAVKFYPDLGKRGCYKDRIAFYVASGSANYFLPIARHLDPSQADIVFDSEFPLLESAIEEHHLERFNIKFGQRSLTDYKCFVCDYNTMPEKSSTQVAIGLFHGVDAFASENVVNKLNAIIVSYQKSAEYLSIKSNYSITSLLESLNYEDKCEIAWSGPYHTDGYSQYDKMELRWKIKEEYGIDIPVDKPMIYFLEDEVSFPGQIIYCLNKLASYCTIVIKTLSNELREHVHKLDKRIFVLKKRGLANNLMRFAADFIFASYYSGSAMSTLMLGQSLICYYSRLCKYKGALKYHIWRKYDNLFAEQSDPVTDKIFGVSPKVLFLTYLHNNGMLFDLLDVEKIKDGILDKKYINKYNMLLPCIQDATFGEYKKDGSAKYTASLITSFAQNHTFGKNCAGFFFKNRPASMVRSG